MKKNEYSDLSQIACEILATPTSTAPVEHVFFQGRNYKRQKKLFNW